MHKIIIKNTTPLHLFDLRNNIREKDKIEIESYGISINKAIWHSFKESIVCKTAFVDGEVAAIFGVGGNPLEEEGRPWLLTTMASEKISALAFARVYQKEVLQMLKIFPKLANYVDASYTKSMRLLENIGFKLGEPEVYGTKGNLFRKFEMRNTK